MNPYVENPQKLGEELQSDGYEGYTNNEIDKNGLRLLKQRLSKQSRNIKVK